MVISLTSTSLECWIINSCQSILLYSKFSLKEMSFHTHMHGEYSANNDVTVRSDNDDDSQGLHYPRRCVCVHPRSDFAREMIVSGALTCPRQLEMPQGLTGCCSRPWSHVGYRRHTKKRKRSKLRLSRDGRFEMPLENTFFPFSVLWSCLLEGSWTLSSTVGSNVAFLYSTWQEPFLFMSIQCLVMTS